jgi:transposase-like protein
MTVFRYSCYMETPKTLLEAITFFSDAENCRQFMISVRWLDGVVRCPRCGSEDVSYMPKAKQYHCKSKKHTNTKFSLKVGTIFEDSPIGLEKWLPAAWLISNCKNGISSYEIARALGVTQKSAWHMLHRLREAMTGGFMFKMGGNGPIEIDETHFGPNTRKMHANKRLKLSKEGYQKPAVMGMLDRENRQVRAKVVPNVKRETLQNEILDQIERGTKIYTDSWPAYDGLTKEQYIHDTVNHMQEYVRGQVHTQGIENFWSCLKRGLRGTYVAVEPFHLDRYVSEQVFRFNNRATKDNPLNDADRFTLLMSQITGKRLTYAELIGRPPQRPA